MRRNAINRSTALYDTPFGNYERHVLRCYALAAFLPEKGKQRHCVADSLADWYRDNRTLLGYRVAPLDTILKRGRPEHDFSGQISLRYNGRDLPAHQVSAPPASSLQKRLDWVATTLSLSKEEAAFLGAVVRLTHVHRFFELYAAVMNGHDRDDEVRADMAARMAGLTPRQSWPLTDRRSALVQLGLIEDRGGGDVSASTTLVELLATRSCNEVVLRRSLLGETATSALAMADFAHLGAMRDTVTTLLDRALSKPEKGASLLFYGAPGTGKTEFAKLVAAQISTEMVFVGERKADTEDHRFRSEPSRADRLSHLAFASALAERAGRVVLVIDEADEIFSGVDDEEFSNRSGSKVFMNRLVENCPVPMIWITNHPDRLGNAVVRRMLYAAEFPEADRTTRRRIIQRHAAEQGIRIASDAVESLASLPAAPALLGTGIRAAALASLDGEAAGNMAFIVTRSLLRVAGVNLSPVPSGSPLAFDASLSNADTDLAQLERQVVAAGGGALSFLFSGIPGTGKSAYARHLAERLGLEVLEKRASDLLGMYVGESEKRIADAFAEAADTRRFLILDEVDSLLADRNGAQRNWEVSQVNEMLTWMERHPTPFAATTNLADQLDPATQRRFLFKVKFQAMHRDQVARCFALTFGRAAPSSLSAIDLLTPSDFALVARKAAILGEVEPELLVQMLAQEVAAKPSANPRRIGF